MIGDVEGFEGPKTGASEVAVSEIDQGKVSTASGQAGEVSEFVIEAEELSSDADGVGKVSVVAVDADQVLEGGFTQAGIAGIAASFDTAFEVDACVFPFFAEVGDAAKVKVSGGLGNGIIFGGLEVDLSGTKLRCCVDVVLGGEHSEPSPCDDQFEGLLKAQGPSDFLDECPTAECFVVPLGEDREFAIDVLCGTTAISVADGLVGGFGFAEASELLREEQESDTEDLPKVDERAKALRWEGFAECGESVVEECNGLFGVVAVALCA